MRRLFYACALLVAACDKHVPPRRPVVAKVSRMPIYEDEFVARWHRAELHPDDAGAPPDASLQVHKRAVLDDMIDRRLLLQEAERAQVNVMHEEVEAAVSKLHSGYADADFADLLAQKDMTAAELRRELRDTLIVRKYIRDYVHARVAVTDAEIDAALPPPAARASRPEEVHAKHIVVKLEDDAERIAREIRAGMRFEDAAAKYSLSPEGKNGGDLGFFPRGVMPAFFDDACFALPINRLSEVVASPYGFHLFWVTQKRAARPVDEASLQKSVEQTLRRDKERAALAQALGNLRAKAAVQIEEEHLARLE